MCPPMTQPKEQDICIHSKMCTFRFINYELCSSLVCQMYDNGSRSHTPAPAPETVWRCCEFLPRAINRKPEDCEMVQKAASKAREKTLAEVYDAMLLSPEIRGDCMRDAIRVVNTLRSIQQQAGDP